MTKRVLFILPSFAIGGTSVSVKNMISLLPHSSFNITIMALYNGGELKSLYREHPQISSPRIVQFLCQPTWKSGCNSFEKVASALCRILNRKFPKLFTFWIKKAINQAVSISEYDTIVACEEGLPSKIVSYINHPNLVAWVRCDYLRYFNDSLKNRKQVFYSLFKAIVCVSEKTAENFKAIYPEYSSKVHTIHNPQNEQYIVDQSKINDNDTRFKTDLFTIVSIGRFDPVKRFNVIPNIAKKIIAKGLKFRWYVIGDGNVEEKKALLNNIESEAISDSVIYLGYKTNPHFYISQANLLVTLSTSEACPRVVNEAKILHTPVVSTDFSTIYEYIENNVDGCIGSIDEIEPLIYKMMTDSVFYNKIKQKIQSFSFDNSELMDKVVKVLS